LAAWKKSVRMSNEAAMSQRDDVKFVTKNRPQAGKCPAQC
jgi:hypothetical protein